MKRLAIYAFYDPDGVVDDYVVDSVSAIVEHCDRVLVVSNGSVAVDSARRLTALSAVELVERSNEGFDIWGYKHGLELVGWASLEQYDEVILMNSTIAGPLYPLSELFDVMDAQDVDFWGLTAHAGEDYDPWDLLPTGKIERHIQSYFTVIRNSMLRSEELRRYWQSLPRIHSYAEAVALHEAVFTHTFAGLGFRWATYVDGADLDQITSYPLMFLPEQVLIDKRCPFFKRKALLLGAPDLAATHASSTVTMLECLNRLGYDLARVLPNVIRTSHQADIRLSLNAFTVLGSTPRDDPPHLSAVRVLARVKDVQGCLVLERFRSVLEQCGDVLILADHGLDDDVLRRLAAFEARLVSAAGLRDFVLEIGRAAETDSYLLVIGCMGGGFALDAYSRYEQALRAVAESEHVLASAIAHLDSSSFAGALTSPYTPIRFDTSRADWREANLPLETVLPSLRINVPLDRTKHAWGPFGGVVLAAPGALATDWNLVATTLSGMSRSTAEELVVSLIPFILQSHGRLLAFASPETMTARGVFANHLRQALACVPPVQHRQTARSARVYHNVGAGYSEDQAVVVRATQDHDGRVTFSWQAPPNVKSVRFDPVDGCGVICRGTTVTVNGSATKILPLNSMRFAHGLDVFMTTDPIYRISGVTGGAEVTVTMDAIDYIDQSDFATRFPLDGQPDRYGGSLTLALSAIHSQVGERRGTRRAMLEVGIRGQARSWLNRIRAFRKAL